MKKHLSLSRLHPILVFILFAGCMALVQFATPDMPDNDGFYHIKLAYLMRTESLKPEFPWLPYTILNANEFYDHHFLYHVALTPFTFGDLRLGAKWSAVVFSSLAFISVWYLFYRQRIPLGWLWALALLGISDAFLFRMSITRAQSLSLAMLALGLNWMLESRYQYLGVLAFFYVWMYDAFPLLLVLAGLHLLAVLMLERRLEYRSILFIGIGILLGLFLNPYFPENIVFSYRHMLPKLVDATSVRVGNEWYPYETVTLMENSLPALLAFSGGILALGWNKRRVDVRTLTSLLAALLFGLMLFQARRFIEYFAPFALIFSAFAWAPLLSDREPASVVLAKARPISIPFSLLFLIVLASMIKTLPSARASIQNSKPYDLYAGASEWLIDNSQPGDLVFQTDWDDFPRLFFYNTSNRYLIGLDPTYMQLYDKGSYNLWVLITKGAVSQPSQFIANHFHARFVHTDLKHDKFISRAEKDPGLREVYRDEQAILFEVIRR